MAEATAEKITVPCACGAKLKAPATAVGRKAKCPKCGEVLTVQAGAVPVGAKPAGATKPAGPAKPQARPPAKPAAAPKPPPVDFDDPFDDALNDLASQAQSAAKQQPAGTVCANCRAPMAAGAVLCVACGYDSRTGKAVAGAAPLAKAARPAAKGTSISQFPQALKTRVDVEPPKPSGSLTKGTIISAIFAGVGALVWFGIAAATHLEIGWIAWGVGIAAGFGMMIGYNGTSVNAGAVSAALAVAGIMVGKILIFQVVLLPLVDKKVNELLAGVPDAMKLEAYEATQALHEQGLNPHHASEQQWAAAHAAAEKNIARMSAATREQEMVKARRHLDDARDTVESQNHLSLFLRTMLSPADLVFCAIAVASAFKVATFGGQVEPG